MNKKRILSTILALTMTAGAAMSVSAAEAEEEKVLNVGVNTAPQNISPFTNFTNRQPVVFYLYEPLMYRNEENEMVGVIAKDWSTEDNLTYDIEIYDYVYDTNGNQITAEDVVFSLEHARDEAANTWIESAEVTGDYTLTLTVVDDAVSTFPTAIDRAPIVDKESYEAAEDSMTTSSVSTAAYMVTDFVPNVSITFEKNPNYWQTDEELQYSIYKEATVDKMVFTKISEAAQQSIALETGAIDAFYGIANTEVANFLEGGRDAEDFTALGYASSVSYVLYFANQGLAGDDINFRMAVSHAIDKDMLVAGAFNGMAKAGTFMGAPDGMSDLTPSSASEDYFKYDDALAREYLANSNYNGETIRLLVPNEDNHNRLAAIVQGYLGALGITVTIDSYDNAMFQSNFGDGSTWDIAICQMGMNDPVFVWCFLSYEMSGGENGAMGMAVQDEKLDEFLKVVNSIDGHNVENATAASDYINEMAYGENLVSTLSYIIFRKDLGATEVPYRSISAQERFINCTIFGDAE